MDKTLVEKAARRFLTNGVRGNLPESELAAACDQLVQKASRKSFKAAIRVAEQLAARARLYDGPLQLAAYRCLARIKHLSGAHSEALGLYLEARRRARTDPLVRSRIDRVLIDVYMYLGDFNKSRLAARRAIATFSKLQAASDLAQTQANYGNLLHRQDRHRDAEKLYRKAAEYFETTDNRVALARCYYNRANTLVQLFEMDEAEKLYGQAEDMYTEAGFSLDACDVRYGLAWLWMLSGRYHRALIELEKCRQQYCEGGDPRGEALCILDRAEVYLSLGLYDDALSAARTAEQRFARLKLRYERAKASLFRSQAALALGKRSEAQKAMSRARSGFDGEGNVGFAGAVRLLAADLETDSEARRRELRAARKLFSRSQLAYWEAVCDLKEIISLPRAGSALKRLSKNPAVNQVPHLYALWQTLEGDIELNQGNLSAACRSWRRAAERLDVVRAQLPPLELRTAYSSRQSSPHVRLVAATLEHDPLWAAVWSERYKTAGVWSPVNRDSVAADERARVQASLSRLASQVAGLAHQINEQSGTFGQRGKSLGQAAVRLQKRVRQELLAIEDSCGLTLQSPEELAESFKSVSQELPVIQFHIHDQDIVAFVHDGGRTRVCHFAGGRQRLAAWFQRWRFLLERELLPAAARTKESMAAEHALWKDLGSWLWGGLRVDPDVENLLIIPEGELANLPWGALVCDDRPLIERHGFILAPSLRHFIAASQVRTSSERVEIFRGISGGLPMVAAETVRLAERAGDRAVMHETCGRDDWPMTGEARLWHYSGHAEIREDNPFYSYLVLDGGPLFAADFRLRDCQVNLVTLAACRSGEQVALPGEEATGLVRSLLEMGARNVIAGYWPVADESSSIWMQTFYDLYLADENILGSARRAALTVRENYPSAYHWAAFSVTGAGDIGDNHE